MEKYCRETNFHYDDNYAKWATYRFAKDRKLQLEEYFPKAIEETYKGISAYILFIA